MSDITKTPRLYVHDDLIDGASIDLSADHVHYLVTVMRKTNEAVIRIFNGRDGEYSGKLFIESKKKAQLIDLIKIYDHQNDLRQIHLYITPIKKDRMAFLIEKAVELGVTDIHPAITEYTQHGKINENKMLKQIIEASEQCERMTIPMLHPIAPLMKTDFHCPTHAAIERDDYPKFNGTAQGDMGLLIGPEGGFSKAEIDFLTGHKNIVPCSLGDRILRAETAAIFMLSRIA